LFPDVSPVFPSTKSHRCKPTPPESSLAHRKAPLEERRIKHHFTQGSIISSVRRCQKQCCCCVLRILGQYRICVQITFYPTPQRRCTCFTHRKMRTTAACLAGTKREACIHIYTACDATRQVAHRDLMPKRAREARSLGSAPSFSCCRRQQSHN
ncbi:unnamed protein product, partial [Ectocarpus sp. 4 AP-2014]